VRRVAFNQRPSVPRPWTAVNITIVCLLHLGCSAAAAATAWRQYPRRNLTNCSKIHELASRTFACPVKSSTDIECYCMPDYRSAARPIRVTFRPCCMMLDVRLLPSWYRWATRWNLQDDGDNDWERWLRTAMRRCCVYDWWSLYHIRVAAASCLPSQPTLNGDRCIKTSSPKQG